MGLEEPFSWKKFISGIFAPLNFAKSFVTMIQIVLWVLVIGLLVLGGIFVWRKTKPIPKAPITPVTVSTNSGTVHSSTDDNREKWCLLSLCF